MNKPDKATTEDGPALKYAGMMGHTIAIVAGVSGVRRVVAQCDDIEWAKNQIVEGKWKNPTIYQRKGKVWKKIR